MTADGADAVVVGGGPGGVAAAITLARAGLSVMLVDRATFPRDKTCGDGLTANALRRYEDLGLDPGDIPSWQPVRACVVSGPRGRTARLELPATGGMFAATARRAELDNAFVEVARAHGVDVRPGLRVLGVAPAPGDGQVLVHTDSLGAISVPYVIAADGMWSPVRKSLGLSDPGYLGEWHAYRQYFSATAQPADELWTWFEPDILPGYVWSFPLSDGSANVGFGIRRRPGDATGAMKAKWPALLRRQPIRDVVGSDAAPAEPPRAWPIPASPRRIACTGAGGRVLLVGDAARLADPMTGEGIGQALESGQLAAEAIAAAGRSRPEVAARSYSSTVHRTLALDNRLAALLSEWGLAGTARADLAVGLAGTSGWTRRHFARWLFEDYPRAVLATPRRWRRRLLSGHGAYRAGANAT